METRYWTVDGRRHDTAREAGAAAREAIGRTKLISGYALAGPVEVLEYTPGRRAPERLHSAALDTLEMSDVTEDGRPKRAKAGDERIRVYFRGIGYSVTVDGGFPPNGRGFADARAAFAFGRRVLGKRAKNG